MKITASLYDSLQEALPYISTVIENEAGMTAEIELFNLPRVVKKQFCAATVVVEDTRSGFQILRHEFFIIDHKDYEPFIRAISTSALGRKVIEFPKMKLLSGELIMEFLGALYRFCRSRRIKVAFDYRNNFSYN